MKIVVVGMGGIGGIVGGRLTTVRTDQGDIAADAAVIAEDTAWGTAQANAFQAGNPSARIVRMKNAGHDICSAHRQALGIEQKIFLHGSFRCEKAIKPAAR